MADPAPAADLPQYLRMAARRTRDEGTARIRYERTQVLPRRSDPTKRRKPTRLAHSIRAILKAVWSQTALDKRVQELLYQWTHLAATGVIDFAREHCLLEYGEFRVFLDGDEVLVRMAERGGELRWESSDSARALMAPGGPWWLLDLVERTARAETIPDEDERELHRFSAWAVCDATLPVSFLPRWEDAVDGVEIRFEAWVDEEGMVRQIRHSSDAIGGVSSLKLLDFGEPPALARPVAAGG